MEVNCIVLGKTSIFDCFTVSVCDKNSINGNEILVDQLKISNLKYLIYDMIKKYGININNDNYNELNLWKADVALVNKLENLTEEQIFRDCEQLVSIIHFKKYFPNPNTVDNSLIFVQVPATGLKRSANFQDTRVRKLVKTQGPVDVSKNFHVPLEFLESTRQLEEAIDEKVCVLLVGHFQSGKSSTLHYLQDTKNNYFYIQSSKLAVGFLRGLCGLLSLDLCNNINDFDDKIVKKYRGEQIVIMIDEFDRYLLEQENTVNTIDQMRGLIKLVNDRGAEGIKSIVFAGSFSITTMLEDGNLKIKRVIEVSSQESTEKSSQESTEEPSQESTEEPSQESTEESSQELSQELSQESPQDKKHYSRLQKPVGVPSPLNSARIIEASDFTKEQHIKFFHDIQVNMNIRFCEKVVDDVYSRTNGYAGLEGLLASLCIEYAGNVEALEFSTWNERFTEFIRNPSKRKISAIKHVAKYLTDNTDNNDNTYIKEARLLLERFLQRGTLPSSEFDDDDIAILHLRAIGIIKSQGNDFVFTSNIILDLLSSTYYPFYHGESLSKITVINSPLDFLKGVLNLLKHIRHDVIFDPLAANQHFFSEAVIQGELYALLRTAVSYPLYKVFRETKTLKKSEKRCDVWVCNGREHGAELKVNKVSVNEIKSAAEQAIGYTEGRKKVCSMFVLNFVPQDSIPHDYQFSFPNVDKPKEEIYFETVHILYSQATRTAKILRNCMEDEEISFAQHTTIQYPQCQEKYNIYV